MSTRKRDSKEVKIPQTISDYTDLAVDAPDYLYKLGSSRFPIAELVDEANPLVDRLGNSVGIQFEQFATDLKVSEKVLGRITANTSRAQAADEAFLDITTTERISVGMLFRTSTISGNSVILSKRASGGYQFSVISGGKLQIFGRPTSGRDVLVNTVETHNPLTWHYAVFTIDRVNEVFKIVTELSKASVSIAEKGSFTTTRKFGFDASLVPSILIGSLAIWTGSKVDSIDDEFPDRFLTKVGVSGTSEGAIYVNVKDFPYLAKGDNITDDTLAIELAIKAAGDGGTVFFPTGNYLVNGSINYSARRLLGENYGRTGAGTVIKPITGFTDNSVLSCSNAPSSLEALTIDALGIVDYCVYAFGSTGPNSRHDRVFATNSLDAGFWFNGSQVAGFTQLRAQANAKIGILIQDCNSALFSDCHSTLNNGDGIRVTRSVAGGTVTLLACQSEGNGGYGIYLKGAGIGGNKLDQPRVRDCILEGNMLTAIRIELCVSALISGNRVLVGPNQYPIELVSSTNSQIVENVSPYNGNLNSLEILDDDTARSNIFKRNRRLSALTNEELVIQGHPSESLRVGNNFQYYDSATPVTGAFVLGDIVWNVAPVIGEPVGWRCVTAGAPGAWEEFGRQSTIVISSSNWVLTDIQAYLDAGVSLEIASGTYDLGSSAVGLDFTQLDTSFICKGNVRFNYTGTGTAIRLSPGSSGIISGFEVDGINAGYGIEVYGTGMRLSDFRIRSFQTGLYCSGAEIVSFRHGLIQDSTFGIDFNTANAQNQVLFYDIKFRTNGTHLRLQKARGIAFEFCDFSSAKGMAVEANSTGGGTFQAVTFRNCWFEKNNTAFTALDNRAEVLIDSGTDGLTVRALRFEQCYFAGSTNVSTQKIRAGSSDKDNITIVGGLPDPLVIDVLRP